MSNATVVKRVVSSTPKRDSVETWDKVVEMLTQGKQSAARDELTAVAGIAASVITEKAPKDAAITVTCDGPRTRIYCLYDEDAIDGSDAKEDALGYDPLAGNWSLSLPCPADDLAWVQRALKAKSKRITARDMTERLGEVAPISRTPYAEKRRSPKCQEPDRRTRRSSASRSSSWLEPAGRRRSCRVSSAAPRRPSPTGSAQPVVKPAVPSQSTTR